MKVPVCFLGAAVLPLVACGSDSKTARDAADTAADSAADTAADTAADSAADTAADSAPTDSADAAPAGCFRLKDGSCVEETFKNPAVLAPDANGVYQLALEPTEFIVDGKRQCGRAYN